MPTSPSPAAARPAFDPATAFTVLATPRRAGLRAGADNTVELLLRVQAPAAPGGHAAQRPPQALALVIDRSGSMSGRPLAEARRCAEQVLARLRPDDHVALVQFDHRVQRLWPAVPLGDGAGARAALDALCAGGNTNLYGGWLEGAEALSDLRGDGLKRVILLSDGCANEGLVEPAEIAAQCGRWAARGITTSTYGLGGQFNEALMVAMARGGGGQHYYGETAEDLREPFEQELALLESLCLRELRLAVQPVAGTQAEVLNDLPRIDGAWRLPDLAWGAEAWVALRLVLPAAALPPGGQRALVLEAQLAGRLPDGRPLLLERARLALPVLSAAAHDALPEDALVARRLLELEAADALLAMRLAAEAQDWHHVDAMLAAAERRFGAHEWLRAMLESMRALAAQRDRDRAMKEMLYSSGRLRSRLTATDEPRFSIADPEAGPAYLRRKPAQGKGLG